MADLFTGSAPDPVTLTSTTTQTQPQYLTDFQKALASTATGFLGKPIKDASGNITGYETKTGEELVGDRPDYLANLQGGINPATGKPYTSAELPSLADLQRGQGALDQALTAGTDASGVTESDISKFYDPYQTQVIDEMQRQSDVNLQRNLMPALRALGVGTSGGAAGNRRTYDISGQALADVASQLQSQQTAARSAGFKQALDAALKEQGVQASAASALGQVGAAESAAAERGIKTLSDVGAADLAYRQALIDAPLTRSINIGKIMQGYTYPTSTTASKQELPSQMSASPLQQVAGLGSLIGALFPSKLDAQGNVTFGGLGGAAFKSLLKGLGFTDSQTASLMPGYEDNATITGAGNTGNTTGNTTGGTTGGTEYNDFNDLQQESYGL
jgi:hypothetical protein